jgi:hypothetical protein
MQVGAEDVCPVRVEESEIAVLKWLDESKHRRYVDVC